MSAHDAPALARHCRVLVDAFAAPVDEWHWLQHTVCVVAALGLGAALGCGLWVDTVGRNARSQREAIALMQARLSEATRKLAHSKLAGALDIRAATGPDASRYQQISAALVPSIAAAAQLSGLKIDRLRPVERPRVRHVGATAGTDGEFAARANPGASAATGTQRAAGAGKSQDIDAASGSGAPGETVQLKLFGSFTALSYFSERLVALPAELSIEQIDVVRQAEYLRIAAILSGGGVQEKAHPRAIAGNKAASDAQPVVSPPDLSAPRGRERLDPFGGPALSARLARAALGSLVGTFVQGRRRAALVQSAGEFALLTVGSARAGAVVTRIERESISVSLFGVPPHVMALDGPMP